MYFHIWKPSASGSAPTGWTPLKLTYGDSNCLVLRFLAPEPTEEFELRNMLQAQLINEI
jgi:hypothetical protein